MKLIFGLGNPGKTYTHTLHNIGFLTVDYFLNDIGVSADKTKFSSLYCKTRIGDETCIFIKPQTFMNLSGKSFVPFINQFKPEPEDIIVIHDDVDIAECAVKIKLGGGDGGHKGIRSIIAESGKRDFVRVRVGAGRPPENIDVSDYVLHRITKSSLMPFVEKSLEALNAVLKDGWKKAANYINSDGSRMADEE